MSYADDLKSPRWQEKRLRVFERARFRCERCGSTEDTLHAHHKVYLKGRKPWDYEDILLECLCDTCHGDVHDEMEQLGLIVARQPTAMLPDLMDAVARVVPKAPTDPRMQTLFQKLGKAMVTHSKTDFIDAQNELQDIIDEHRDFERGPGGAG